MNKTLIFKQMNKYKSYNIAIAISFLISSLFITSSLFLILSSFALVQTPESSNTTLIFIILFGILFLISNLLSLIIMKMNLEIRRKETNDKRVLGFSHRRIFLDLLKEQLLILIPMFILGFLLSIPINNLLVSYLKEKNILDSTFTINLSVLSTVGTLLFSIIFTMLLVFISTRGYKILLISNINQNKFAKKSIILKSIFGLLFLIAFLSLIIFTKTEIIYLFGGIFFAVFVWLLGPMLISQLMNLLFIIFRKNFIFGSSFKNIKNNLNRIILIVVILVIVMVFLNFSINIIGRMTPKTFDESENIKYLNGLKFLTAYLNIVLISFGALIIINGLIMYLLSIKKENNNLRILGLTRKKILRRNLIQFIIIFLISLIFIFISTMFISIIWNDYAILLNWKTWVYECLVIFGIFLLIPIIEHFLLRSY